MDDKYSVKTLPPEVVKQVRKHNYNKEDPEHPVYNVEERKGTGKATCRNCNKPIETGESSILFQYAHDDERPWMRQRMLVHKDECGDTSKEWTRCPKPGCGQRLRNEDFSAHWKGHVYDQKASNVTTISAGTNTTNTDYNIYTTGTTTTTAASNNFHIVCHCGQCQEDQGKIVPFDEIDQPLPPSDKKPSPVQKVKRVLQDGLDSYLDYVGYNEKPPIGPVDRREGHVDDEIRKHIAEDGDNFEKLAAALEEALKIVKSMMSDDEEVQKTSHAGDGNHVHDPFVEGEDEGDYWGFTGTQNCDYGHYTSDARRLPIGENAGVWVCQEHYAQEMQGRQERRDERGTPAWESLDKQSSRTASEETGVWWPTNEAATKMSVIHKRHPEDKKKTLCNRSLKWGAAEAAGSDFSTQKKCSRCWGVTGYKTVSQLRDSNGDIREPFEPKVIKDKMTEEVWTHNQIPGVDPYLLQREFQGDDLDMAKVFHLRDNTDEPAFSALMDPEGHPSTFVPYKPPLKQSLNGYKSVTASPASDYWFTEDRAAWEDRVKDVPSYEEAFKAMPSPEVQGETVAHGIAQHLVDASDTGHEKSIELLKSKGIFDPENEPMGNRMWHYHKALHQQPGEDLLHGHCSDPMCGEPTKSLCGPCVNKGKETWLCGEHAKDEPDGSPGFNCDGCFNEKKRGTGPDRRMTAYKSVTGGPIKDFLMLNDPKDHNFEAMKPREGKPIVCKRCGQPAAQHDSPDGATNRAAYKTAQDGGGGDGGGGDGGGAAAGGDAGGGDAYGGGAPDTGAGGESLSEGPNGEGKQPSFGPVIDSQGTKDCPRCGDHLYSIGGWYSCARCGWASYRQPKKKRRRDLTAYKAISQVNQDQDATNETNTMNQKGDGYQPRLNEPALRSQKAKQKALIETEVNQAQDSFAGMQKKIDAFSYRTVTSEADTSRTE